MTKIQPGRPVTRQTDAFCSHFPIIIEAHPKYLVLRLKCQHESHTLTWEHLYSLAVREAAHKRLRQRAFDRTLKRVG